MRLGGAITLALLVLAWSTPAVAQTSQKTQIEIYRIAPGKHEAFLRHLALADQALEAAGLPPRQLFVHQDGADWDFLIMQPAGQNLPAAQRDALSAARKKLGLPSGARFFIEFRQYIAAHTDTVTEGPTTAGAWLAKLDEAAKR